MWQERLTINCQYNIKNKKVFYKKEFSGLIAIVLLYHFLIDMLRLILL